MSIDGVREQSTSLIRHVAERLTSVIDEESQSHEAICSLMMELATGDGSASADMQQLIEALQYFDRLQQRAGALCLLVSNLTAALDMDDDPGPVAEAFCATAPVADDAEWLSGLQQVVCSARSVDGAMCETWPESDVTQTF